MSGSPVVAAGARGLQGILIKQDELSLILLQMNHDPNGYFAEYLRHGKSSDFWLLR
jgi:hypothetical protein